MKKRILSLILSTLSFSLALHAQNEVDALRYSQQTFGGTARYNAMGGAFGALGGDFSALSSNPAGMAIYRRSEISFSPSFFYQNITSNFKNNSFDDYKTKVNFGNAGVVFAYYNADSKNE